MEQKIGRNTEKGNGSPLIFGTKKKRGKIKLMKLMAWYLVVNIIKFDKSLLMSKMGFPCCASGKEPACQCGRRKNLGFGPWIREIPWMRAWQPVLLPGQSYGQRSLEGYSPQGRTESDTTEVT